MSRHPLHTPQSQPVAPRARPRYTPRSLCYPMLSRVAVAVAQTRTSSRTSSAHTSDSLAPGVSSGKENIPMQSSSQNAPLKPTRITRHSGLEPAADGTAGRPAGSAPVGVNNHDTRLSHILTSAPPPSAASLGRPPTRSSAPAKPAGKLALQSHTHTVGHSKPLTIATSSPHVVSASRQQQKPPPIGGDEQKAGRPDRNIDKVVLGNICFRAWYPHTMERKC